MVCVFSTEDNDFTLVILKGFFWDPNQTWSIPVIIKKKAGQTSESSSTMNHGFYVFLKKKHLSNFLLQQRLVKCMIYLDKFRTDDRKMTVISVESISHEIDAFLFQLLHLIHCLITWTNNVTHL